MNAKDIAVELLESGAYMHERSKEADHWVKYHEGRLRHHSQRAAEHEDGNRYERALDHDAAAKNHQEAADSFREAKKHYAARDKHLGDAAMIAGEHQREHAHKYEDSHDLNEGLVDEVLEASYRSIRLQHIKQRRAANASARSRGFRNARQMAGDDDEREDTRQADRFDHARDQRKHD